MLLLRRWSHVGRRPIPIESNVNIDLLVPPTRLRPAFGKTGVGNIIRVTGPLGSMGLPLHHGLKLTVGPGLVQDERLLRIEVDQESFDRMSKYSQKFVRAMWGTTTSLLRRHGFQVPLRLVGVGFKAVVEGKKINLKVGYSHELLVPIPTGIKASTPIPTKIVLSGTNYHMVTQFAAKLRSYRVPEPYNGKGIFVGSETIVIKEGKKK